MQSLKGKSILIAGATGGFGQVISLDLVNAGARLMLIHQKDDQKALSLKERLKQYGTDVTFYRCDFTNADEINDGVDQFFEQGADPYAHINLIGDPARVDWQKAQIHHMQDSFLRNASAPLHAAKYFASKMQNAKRSGAIVLFSSMQGLYPFEGSLYYGTAKAALAHGTRILAKDFGGSPFIRINGIAPGVNQAGMAEESIRKGKYEKFVDQHIIPRYGSAENISRLVFFLLDPDLYMTGQTLLFDGGLTLRRDLLR